MAFKETHYIYFLIDNGSVVYIGCSMSLPGRMQVHKYEKPHTSVRLMGPYSRKFAFKNEARWIKRFRPIYTILCECCGVPAVDLHHIEPRSSFGSKRKGDQDHVSNLIALCRLHHDLAHGPESRLWKERFKEIIAKRDSKELNKQIV